jgi:hypothetical protein
MENVEKYYKDSVVCLFMSVPTLIKHIHFNKDHPENHNILFMNYRSGMATIFDGTYWITIDADVLIKELINTYETALEEFANKNSGYMKYLDEYNFIKERDGKEKVYKDLEREVKRVLYYNNKIVNRRFIYDKMNEKC